VYKNNTHVVLPQEEETNDEVLNSEQIIIEEVPKSEQVESNEMFIPEKTNFDEVSKQKLKPLRTIPIFLLGCIAFSFLLNFSI